MVALYHDVSLDLPSFESVPATVELLSIIILSLLLVQSLYLLGFTG